VPELGLADQGAKSCRPGRAGPGCGDRAAGNQLWDAYRYSQNLFNETTANDQTNKYQDFVTKLQFGDPAAGDARA
jgi:hypothetical protein